MRLTTRCPAQNAGSSRADPASSARCCEGVLAGPLPGLPVRVPFKGGLGRQLEAVRRRMLELRGPAFELRRDFQPKSV